LVHDESERWKAAYLQWIDDLGQTSMADTNVEQSLLLQPGLSYWWMTLPSQFCFSEDALAYQAMRLWAFVELADRLRLKEIELVGAHPDLVCVLSEWARRTGRILCAKLTPEQLPGRVSVSRAFPRGASLFRNFLQAGSHIARLVLDYGHYAGDGLHVREPNPRELTVVDYFDNFRVNESWVSRYQSNYWGRLPEELARLNIPVHWIHIDCRSASARTVRIARKAIQELNENHAHQRHSLLQDHLNARVFARILQRYLRIVSIGLKSRRLKRSWGHSPDELDMWPLVRGSWRSWFYGLEAAANASWVTFFETAIGVPGKLGSCWYLMENQPWEFALVNQWTRASAGAVSGVPHSAVRQWDLRYAVGFTLREGDLRRALPKPDFVLVNGPAASHVLGQKGYQVHSLQPVEALRYLVNGQSPKTHRLNHPGKTGRLKVLVLGEYDEFLEARQVELVNSLIDARSLAVQPTFRQHPSAPRQVKGLDPRIDLSSATTIAADLRHADLAFCSSVSSAALDCLLAGVPVIVFCDGNVLDGQISIGAETASVTNADQLISAVDRILADGTRSERRATDIFFLDETLPLWAGVISQLGHVSTPRVTDSE
jgi:surface carbohydrate biosynthesis protein (TIGR04326 family)